MENINELTFEEIEKTIFKKVCENAVEMTITLLQKLDDHIMKTRDKKRYISKQKRQVAIKTVYGTVEYKRRMYYDREDKIFVYLLDEQIAMEKIGTISSNLAKLIADASIEMPFRKAAETITKTTGQSISSHGAWNVVQNIGTIVEGEEKEMLSEMKKDKPKGKKETKILFIEADGVYLKIQNNKKKAKSQELKLATIYEGWSPDGKKLQSKKVIAGMENSNKFNEKTEALIMSVYNINKIGQRVLNGDGAAWITNTYNINRIFQLDRFHIYKKIRTCVSHENIQYLIIKSLKEYKIDKALETIQTYINSLEGGSKSKLRLAKDLQRYLINNKKGLLPWQLQINKMPLPPEGVIYKNMGIQENQNCSLVCMRMKGRKMRWSVKGANNLAKLIYTRENGNLDKIIEKVDGKIIIPEEIDFKDILSADEVSKKIGKDRWAERLQVKLPIALGSNNGFAKTIRAISRA